MEGRPPLKKFHRADKMADSRPMQRACFSFTVADLQWTRKKVPMTRNSIECTARFVSGEIEEKTHRVFVKYTIGNAKQGTGQFAMCLSEHATPTPLYYGKRYLVCEAPHIELDAGIRSPDNRRVYPTFMSVYEVPFWSFCARFSNLFDVRHVFLQISHHWLQSDVFVPACMLPPSLIV